MQGLEGVLNTQGGAQGQICGQILPDFYCCTVLRPLSNLFCVLTDWATDKVAKLFW